jgi:hypothetical protein
VTANRASNGLAAVTVCGGFVAASLLPRKADYEGIADQLPRGEVLLVLPPADSPERQTMERLA